MVVISDVCFFFFFNDTATTEIYTLSLHDALPISVRIKSRIDRGGVVENVWAENIKAKDMQREFVILNMDYSSDRDRKSTRLNSSHANISYAVFCLKKKKTKSTTVTLYKSGVRPIG